MYEYEYAATIEARNLLTIAIVTCTMPLDFCGRTVNDEQQTMTAVLQQTEQALFDGISRAYFTTTLVWPSAVLMEMSVRRQLIHVEVFDRVEGVLLWIEAGSFCSRE
jgi:hypothetical protein